MDQFFSVVQQIWQSATTASPLPSPATTLWCVLGALVLVSWPATWRICRHAITIVHEAGHGFAAVLTGRRLSGIRLHSDTSGVTLSVGKPRGFGMFLTAAAGYPAAALLGVGAAALLAHGYAAALLWLLVLVLALTLVQIRNWFGLWSILVTGLVVVGVTWLAPEEVVSAAAVVVTAFLLFGAPRTVLELQRERRRTRSRDSDADQLGKLTHTPGLLWVGFFLLVTLGALVLSGWWLFDAVSANSAG